MTRLSIAPASSVDPESIEPESIEPVSVAAASVSQSWPTEPTARRVPARAFLSDRALADVRTRQTWRGVWMIAHAWGVILGAVTLVALWPNPVTVLAAIAIIGSRQLGLAILMHEGAHGLLARDATVNLWLSQIFCAFPVGAETRAYRRYHLQHHAHTQTAADPDLILTTPFPITAASYRRKFIRDITGQTGFEQRKAQLLDGLGDASWPWRRRLAHLRVRLGSQLAAQAVLALGFALAGVWWAYPLLWVLPVLTWFQVVTRVRNIAEHAVISDSTDPLRNTRTTLAGWLERAFVAPYFVNYHLEHHLVFYVPAYNLPKVHRLLMGSALASRVEVAQGYRTVLRKAVARPAAEDAPGELVNVNRRRQRAAHQATGATGDDQARGGF
jgi:fatty acid desaturase